MKPEDIKKEIAWFIENRKLANRKFTMADIKHYNEQAGQHFFEKATMKFFASRVESAPYIGPGGIFFITSEKCGFESTERKFAIRQFNPENGHVNTVGDTFNKFQYIESARQEARDLAKRAPQEPIDAETMKRIQECFGDCSVMLECYTIEELLQDYKDESECLAEWLKIQIDAQKMHFEQQHNCEDRTDAQIKRDRKEEKEFIAGIRERLTLQGFTFNK